MTHTCSHCGQIIRWAANHAITKDGRVLHDACASDLGWKGGVAVGDAYLATRLLYPEATT